MPTDKQEQMYLDNGPDSFLAEVIQIVKPQRLHIDIEVGPDGHDVVWVVFRGHTGGGIEFSTVESGRSYGEALRKVRERLRLEVGQ